MPELAERLFVKLKNWRDKVGAWEMTVNPDYDPDKSDWRFENRKGWRVKDGIIVT
ncbi:MAG: hypothetical protein U5R06_02810 [candidate division KSB1 bacterium]|nr:hypothetical protein [candidate division KSB1 bacterium]